MRHEINSLAEIKNVDRERDFHDGEIRRGLGMTRNAVLIFGVVNISFFVLEIFFLNYEKLSFLVAHSLFPRLVSMVFAVGVALCLEKCANKPRAIKSVAAFAAITYLMHEYTAAVFSPVELIFEVLDIVIATFVLFIIPNRWIVNIGVSLFMVVVFLAMSPFTMPNIPFGTRVVLSVYLLLHIFVLGFFMHRINVQKRVHFLEQIRLERVARIDSLTKIPNRAACDEMLVRMCSAGGDFSVILIDMDNFKRINDTYGHLAGDEVIVTTVEAVKKGLGSGNIITRWGGEEFVVILPRTNIGEAGAKAETIRRLIESEEHKYPVGKVTASLGVTEFVPGDDALSVINRVDMLMYQAKRQGKNRVVAG